MTMQVGGKNGDRSAEPNVVPLCDVLLVLLIIFMVVTPLIQKGADVKLPTAMNTIDMPENPDIVLYIRRDGNMFVNSDQATIDNLQMTATDKRLYLKADQELEYGIIVDLIDIVKEAGVEIVGIIADKKAETLK